MAAVPPALFVAPLQPQQLAPPPVGSRTHLEYYNDARNDPWNGAYAGLMAQYEPVTVNTPKALLRQMLAYGPSMLADISR
jgi:hypothetical protein